MRWKFDRFLQELDYLGRLLNKRMDCIRDYLDLNSMVRCLDLNLAKETIREFFKDRSIIYALGIDGSMSYEERMEIIVLYIAVSGFKAPIRILNDGSVKPLFNEIKREDKYTFSTVIPVWIEDLNDILGGSNIGDVRSLEATLESIPFSLMTFGEYYMGLEGIKGDIDILLLDRPIASSIHSYRRDARRLIFEDNGGTIVDMDINGERLSIADLFLGVFIGPMLGRTPLFKMPYRGRFKLYSVIQIALENGGSIDVFKLCSICPKACEEWSKLKRKFIKLNNALSGELLDEYMLESRLVINRERLNYWNKIIKLINLIGHRLFHDEYDEHPLLINDAWITTRDLNTLILLMIYEIARLERERNKIVVGIGKDTYVTDLCRSVIPTAIELKLVDKNIKLPIKSDRPLLTLASSLHPDIFKPPWRLAGYDDAFATLVKPSNEGLRAARRVIYPEGLLVRVYFQLRKLKGINNIEVKSPVFFYDRFQRSEFDDKFRVKLNAFELDKNVLIRPYLEIELNPLDNMILYILSLMDKPEITEATGHNYLLFMADKDVKAAISMVKKAVINVADMRISRIIRERGIFIVTRRFRDFRRFIERRRG